MGNNITCHISTSGISSFVGYEEFNKVKSLDDIDQSRVICMKKEQDVKKLIFNLPTQRIPLKIIPSHDNKEQSVYLYNCMSQNASNDDDAFSNKVSDGAYNITMNELPETKGICAFLFTSAECDMDVENVDHIQVIDTLRGNISLKSTRGRINAVDLIGGSISLETEASSIHAGKVEGANVKVAAAADAVFKDVKAEDLNCVAGSDVNVKSCESSSSTIKSGSDTNIGTLTGIATVGAGSDCSIKSCQTSKLNANAGSDLRISDLFGSAEIRSGSDCTIRNSDTSSLIVSAGSDAHVRIVTGGTAKITAGSDATVKECNTSDAKITAGSDAHVGTIKGKCNIRGGSDVSVKDASCTDIAVSAGSDCNLKQSTGSLDARSGSDLTVKSHSGPVTAKSGSDMYVAFSDVQPGQENNLVAGSDLRVQFLSPFDLKANVNIRSHNLKNSLKSWNIISGSIQNDSFKGVITQNESIKKVVKKRLSMGSSNSKKEEDVVAVAEVADEWFLTAKSGSFRMS